MTSDNPILNIVLFQPEIPQNAGNIGRSCLAIGAKLWFVRPLGFQMDSRYLKRAGMDYWEHVDCEVVDCWEDLVSRIDDSFKKSQHTNSQAPRYWFLTKFAQKLVWDAQFQRGDVLVFGSESKGLPESLRAANLETSIKLPMLEDVRSLNLASTANTIMYEAVRQFGGLT